MEGCANCNLPFWTCRRCEFFGYGRGTLLSPDAAPETHVTAPVPRASPRDAATARADTYRSPAMTWAATDRRRDLHKAKLQKASRGTAGISSFLRASRPESTRDVDESAAAGPPTDDAIATGALPSELGMPATPEDPTSEPQSEGL